MDSQPYLNYVEDDMVYMKFLVKRENDGDYVKEVADYNEDLKLVYDNSGYWLTHIQFKDTRYLVP